ncbi:o-succinylbenzoate--CoA ligase [Pseudonocardia spinosispora]|uniref:o-succinylbenzoate--CoA ligase n=1 Tax=Pseudonocardia spinosispora TaxID=103441 RepID=UPI00055BA745|nr:o-succinylbenzoate--CoA ligase [Pseudonocardia spinosispora]
MRVVRCDGSPADAATLVEALAQALDGGPAVLPYDGERPTVPAGPVEPGAAVLIETTGSTGAAKRVVLTADALRAGAAATHSRLGGPGRWLLALPTHHVAGVQVIVRALLAGAPPSMLDSRDGFRVPRFARAASALFDAAPPGARHYTSLVPTQMHRVLADGGAALDALRRFDAVLIGGAATSTTLLAETLDAGVRAVTTYGMSETAGGCVYDGVPLDGVDVRLEGNDEEGRISLSGPMLASGYLDRPELTTESFTDGWFRTSDLGRWDGSRLRVLGRADDVITTGGESVNPASVERLLTAQPGIRAACVVGLDDPEWGQTVAAALVLSDPATDVGEQLSKTIRAELGSPSVPRLVRVIEEIPLRGIGKPDRGAVMRLLRSGTS